MVPYGVVWSHILQYGPVRFLIVLYGPVWSSIAPYGPKWFHTGCPTILYPLWFLNFRLSRGVETPSLTFFNSSLCVDFENIQFLLFGEIWIKILAKYYSENIIKVFVYCSMKQFSTHELS